jgi:PadR family transcriptional regulator, regulatory protein PadR
MNDIDRFEQLRRGLLEFVVLKIIAARKVYAADILRSLGVTDFATGEGTLYPLVSRLRREGLIDYEWVESEAGPPRKYFHLTMAGIKQLKDLEAYWKTINQTITQIGVTK